ncbi:hypothetical protein DAPPUDRAFT_239037 [Daphnia pulex]|uniref:Uncharacterized protein n=1 Tax=Daphnia pulex TaxID=6669 RepID=E9G860_DAPPU|nr:hypothetical protein DAPPUDRAFT_239037 [Daphnia pulex]|eukprot:EFX83921.1 hypothetical protein DAPPUDRAFT_239037 [Daphnia pulex]
MGQHGSTAAAKKFVARHSTTIGSVFPPSHPPPPAHSLAEPLCGCAVTHKTHPATHAPPTLRHAQGWNKWHDKNRTQKRRRRFHQQLLVFAHIKRDPRQLMR